MLPTGRRSKLYAIPREVMLQGQIAASEALAQHYRRQLACLRRTESSSDPSSDSETSLSHPEETDAVTVYPSSSLFQTTPLHCQDLDTRPTSPAISLSSTSSLLISDSKKSGSLRGKRASFELALHDDEGSTTTAHLFPFPSAGGERESVGSVDLERQQENIVPPPHTRHPPSHSSGKRRSYRAVDSESDVGSEAPVDPRTLQGTVAMVDIDESLDKFWHRAGWLVGLLVIQSTSSFILKGFSDLIQSHPVVVYFLTMLIGAGGNAGSQSSVLIIRGLAIGRIAPGNRLSFLCEQMKVGGGLAILLFFASFLRVYFFEGDSYEVFAVCVSMLCIVITSVFLGTLFPLGLVLCGVDPAHAGAAIQVTMDIVGVTLTCGVSWIVLDCIAPRIQPGYGGNLVAPPTLSSTPTPIMSSIPVG